jgi:hypothetical protein
MAHNITALPPHQSKLPSHFLGQYIDNLGYILDGAQDIKDHTKLRLPEIEKCLAGLRDGTIRFMMRPKS